MGAGRARLDSQTLRLSFFIVCLCLGVCIPCCDGDGGTTWGHVLRLEQDLQRLMEKLHKTIAERRGANKSMQAKPKKIIPQPPGAVKTEAKAANHAPPAASHVPPSGPDLISAMRERAKARVKALAEAAAERSRTSADFNSSLLQIADMVPGQRGKGVRSWWPQLRSWAKWDLPAGPKLRKLFPSEASRVLDPSKFRLRILVLVFNRVGSTLRCLDSLADVDFLGDSVSLDIFVDHAYDMVNETWATDDATAQATRKELLHLLDNFEWPHGDMRVRARVGSVGIQRQWLEAWWPQNVNEFAFVVEDDMEVSPFMYTYVKRMIWWYYYTRANYRPYYYGLSLTQAWSLIGEKGRPLAPRSEPYAYHMPGTWGQVLFPIPWKEFRLWFEDIRYHPAANPVIYNTMTHTWWKSMGNRIWTPWFIRWVYGRDYHCLYISSFPRNSSLAVSYHEAEADSDSPAAQGFTAPLLAREEFVHQGQLLPLSSISSLSITPQMNLPSWWTYMPSAEKLLHFDWCFHQLPPLQTSLGSLQELLDALPAFNATKDLIIVPMGGSADAYAHAMNWLCSSAGLGIPHLFVFARHPNYGGTGTCARHAAALNKAIDVHALKLAMKGHLTLTLPGPEEDEANCTTASLADAHRAVFSLRQAELIAELVQREVRVLVVPPWVFVLKDPFNCLLSQGHDPPVTAWADKGSISQSFAIFANGTAASALEFNAFVEGWRASGGVDMHANSSVAATELEAWLRLQGVPGAVGGANCIDTQKGESTAVMLANEDRNFLSSMYLWLVNDNDLTCKSIICKKT